MVYVKPRTIYGGLIAKNKTLLLILISLTQRHEDTKIAKIFKVFFVPLCLLVIKNLQNKSISVFSVPSVDKNNNEKLK